MSKKKSWEKSLLILCVIAYNYIINYNKWIYEIKNRNSFTGYLPVAVNSNLHFAWLNKHHNRVKKYSTQQIARAVAGGCNRDMTPLQDVMQGAYGMSNLIGGIIIRTSLPCVKTSSYLNNNST